MNCVETYVQRNETAQAELEALVPAEGKTDVAIMETTWADRLRQEGRLEGLLDGRRELFLLMLEDRFGPLPGSARARIAEIDAEGLSRLATELLDASSLDDLGL